MKTLKTLIVLAILGGGIYFAYGYLNQAETDNSLTLTEGQSIFGETFINSQSGAENKLTAEYNVDIALSVEDNENDVLPTELEKLSGSIYFAYDFQSEINASAELLIDFYLNKSSLPNFGFMASLKEKVLSFTLTNFDTEAGIFLGLDELLGGEEGIDMIMNSFVGQTQNIKLKDSEYREIVDTLTNPAESGEIIINTEEEDLAILQSFIDEQVVEITSAEKNTEGYLLGFKVNSQSIVDFLNQVGEINGIEADFANELPTLSQINVNGEIQINSKKEFQNIEADIVVERSLIDSAQKDLLLGFDYANAGKKSEYSLTLIDAIKNTEQAKLELTVKRD